MMYCVKKLCAAIIVPLILTACGGGTTAECHKEYWDGTVGVCLPKGWTVIEQETLRQRGVAGDTIVAFQASEAVSGQFPTVTVTREALAQVATALNYSDANIRSVSVLPMYELIDSTSMSIDADTVNLHIFTAQPVSDEPARRFYQVSTVANGIGYTVTSAVPVSVKDSIEKEIISILQSTTFEEEVEEEE